jgi:predicted O-linked N-acetylglucosamine transferase (SPINDLY family)
VSPDFRDQAESFFVVPLLEAHDHDQFEIHCYASVAKPDAVTSRHRHAADVWHDVLALSHADLAQQIRDDAIDVLIDLTMHMQNHRLQVFARKPAPIQVTWLAYPGSTGLPTMDYRLTDRYLDPRELETPHYSEESVWLPDSWCCYHPLTQEPPVNLLPASSIGTVTFGCLNNFCKVNSGVLELFARVLQAAERSRLLMLAPGGSARHRVLRQLSEQGILAERIEFVGRKSRPEYLQLYHRIDIALDTLPYNGITTTCDALWMGVPVVSLAGTRPASRAGLSQLSNLGLPELVSFTAEDFARTAVELARDLPRLAELRRTLRTRIESSVLMDAPRFACNVEAAYRTMWRRWCTDTTAPC